MAEPYILDKGRGRLILNQLNDGSALMIEAFGAGQTLLLSKGEMLALAMALTAHARKR